MYIHICICIYVCVYQQYTCTHACTNSRFVGSKVLSSDQLQPTVLSFRLTNPRQMQDGVEVSFALLYASFALS